MRAMVKSEFNKHLNETDEKKIEVAKASAVRALSNYMLYEGGIKDQILGKASQKFNDNVRKGNEANNSTIETTAVDRKEVEEKKQ